MRAIAGLPQAKRKFSNHRREARGHARQPHIERTQGVPVGGGSDRPGSCSFFELEFGDAIHDALAVSGLPGFQPQRYPATGGRTDGTGRPLLGRDPVQDPLHSSAGAGEVRINSTASSSGSAWRAPGLDNCVSASDQVTWPPKLPLSPRAARRLELPAAATLTVPVSALELRAQSPELGPSVPGSRSGSPPLPVRAQSPAISVRSARSARSSRKGSKQSRQSGHSTHSDGGYSNSSLVAVKVSGRCPGVIFPQGRWKVLWDSAVAIMIMYSVLMLPWRIGFGEEAHGFLQVLDLAIDGCFWLDMVLTFLTGFHDDRGMYCSSHAEIAKRYLKGFFFVDFVSVFPTDKVVALASGGSAGSAQLIRMIRLVRLMKLARLVKLKRLTSALEEKLGLSAPMLNMLKTLGQVVFISHLLACSIFWVTTPVCPDGGSDTPCDPLVDDESRPDSTWVRVFSVDHFDQKSRYLAAYHMVTATIMSVGYGDLYPVNTAERLMSISMQIIGAFVFGLILSAVTTLIEVGSPGQVDSQKQLDQVKEWVVERELPKLLKDKVWGHFKFAIANQVSEDEAAFLEQLPRFILSGMVDRMMLEKIECLKSYVFTLEEEASLVIEIARLLRPMALGRGDLLLDAGEPAADIYFVKSGHVQGILDEVALWRLAAIFGGLPETEGWPETSTGNDLRLEHLDEEKPKHSGKASDLCGLCVGRASTEPLFVEDLSEDSRDLAAPAAFRRKSYSCPGPGERSGSDSAVMRRAGMARDCTPCQETEIVGKMPFQYGFLSCPAAATSKPGLSTSPTGGTVDGGSSKALSAENETPQSPEVVCAVYGTGEVIGASSPSFLKFQGGDPIGEMLIVAKERLQEELSNFPASALRFEVRSTESQKIFMDAVSSAEIGVGKPRSKSTRYKKMTEQVVYQGSLVGMQELPRHIRAPVENGADEHLGSLGRVEDDLVKEPVTVRARRMAPGSQRVLADLHENDHAIFSDFVPDSGIKCGICCHQEAAHLCSKGCSWGLCRPCWDRRRLDEGATLGGLARDGRRLEECVEEETHAAIFGRKVIPPSCKHKLYWDLYVGLLILYSVVAVPFRFGLQVEAGLASVILDVFIDVCFLTDLVLCFRTAYVDSEGILETIPSRIRRRYVRSWFSLDIMSTLPFDWIIESFAGPSEGGGTRALKLIRIARLIRLLKLTRLLKMTKVKEQADDSVALSPLTIRTIVLLVKVFFLAHIVGCLWFFMSTVEVSEESCASGALFCSPGSPSTNWVQEAGVHDGANHIKYITAMYWVFTTMTTVGYGDITPTSDAERLYAVLVMVLGATVFGYTIGFIAEFASISQDPLAFKMLKLKHYCEERRLCVTMHRQAKRHYEFFYQERSPNDCEDSLLSSLPPALRTEAVLHIHSATTSAIPLFAGPKARLPAWLVRDTFRLLEPQALAQGEDLLGAEEASQPLDVYFVQRGACEAYVPARVSARPLGRGSLATQLSKRLTKTVDSFRSSCAEAGDTSITILETYPEGSIFGFESLMHASDVTQPRRRIRCGTGGKCEVFVMKHSALEEINGDLRHLVQELLADAIVREVHRRREIIAAATANPLEGEKPSDLRTAGCGGDVPDIAAVDETAGLPAVDLPLPSAPGAVLSPPSPSTPHTPDLQPPLAVMARTAGEQRPSSVPESPSSSSSDVEGGRITMAVG